MKKDRTKLLHRFRRLLSLSMSAEDDVSLELVMSGCDEVWRIDVHCESSCEISLERLCRRSRGSRVDVSCGPNPEVTVSGRFFGYLTIWVFHVKTVVIASEITRSN